MPDKHPATEKDAFASAITFLTTYFQSTTQTFNVEPVVRVSIMCFQFRVNSYKERIFDKRDLNDWFKNNSQSSGFLYFRVYFHGPYVSSNRPVSRF